MGITIPRERLIGSPVIFRSTSINVPITTADGLTLTELLRITIPSEPGWVRLTGALNVQAAVAGQQASVLASIAPAGQSALGGRRYWPLLNVGAASGANSEAYGRQTPDMVALIRPNSPGDWILGAVRVSGSNAANMGGTDPAEAYLMAERL